MKTTSIFLLTVVPFFLFLLTSAPYAVWKADRQQQDPPGFCMGQPRVAEPLLPTPTAEQRLYQGPLHLRVYLHIIRNENGEGGLTPDQIAESLGILEKDFRPFDIFFEPEEEIFYIDEQTLFEDANGTAAVFNNNPHEDGIDIYLFPDHPGHSTAGGGMVYTIPAAAFYIVGRCIEDPKLIYRRTSAISHEMGHCLGLFHTHHAMEQGGCEELVNRNNCIECGDFVCDTPADPGLFLEVDGASCTWSGHALDSQGQEMQPDLHNIMSYTHPRCMTHFSEGQGARMRYYITHHPMLKKCLITHQISKK